MPSVRRIENNRSGFRHEVDDWMRVYKVLCQRWQKVARLKHRPTVAKKNVASPLKQASFVAL